MSHDDDRVDCVILRQIGRPGRALAKPDPVTGRDDIWDTLKSKGQVAVPVTLMKQLAYAVEIPEQEEQLQDKIQETIDFAKGFYRYLFGKDLPEEVSKKMLENLVPCECGEGLKLPVANCCEKCLAARATHEELAETLQEPFNTDEPYIKMIHDLEMHVVQLKRHIADLQSGMYVNCVYCGHRYGPADHAVSIVADALGTNPPRTMAEALTRHIAECKKHPLWEARQLLEEAYEIIADIPQPAGQLRNDSLVWVHDYERYRQEVGIPSEGV